MSIGVNWADDSLAPEYETAATTLKSKGDIKLAKVSHYSSHMFTPTLPVCPFVVIPMGIFLPERDADE